MPFKSKAQSRFIFAKKPALAEEFARKTGSMENVPEYVDDKPKKKKKKSALMFEMMRGK